MASGASKAVGVALCGWGVDAFGYAPVFLGAGAGLVVLAVLFRRTLSPPA